MESDLISDSAPSFREFAELSPVGVLQTFVSGEVIFANRALLQALGFDDVAQLKSAGIASRYRDPQQRLRFVELLRRSGRAENEEVEWLTWTGEPHQFLLSAVLRDEVITGWAIDITKRMAAESQLRIKDAALRMSEANFRAVIEHAPDAVVVHRQGQIVYVNESAFGLLGYRREELVGRSVLELVHPDDRAVVLERVRRLAQAGEPAPPIEERYVHKDGSIVWAEVSALPLLLDGEPAVVAIGRDLTERKQMQAKLMQADRMASVGTLAAGVAHEINNPLAYVVANAGYVAEALAELDDARAVARSAAEPCPCHRILPEVREAVAEVREGAERVRRIVRDLKTFSRADEQAAAPVDVRKVLEAALNIAWNEVRHRARLVKDFAPVPLVDGNEARLCQVFLNLVVNAAQAIPAGHADQNEIRLATRLAGEWVVVEVKDTGCGIAPENLGRLFHPFFTTKPVGLGTGLGLSICQGIVGEHGGDIEVESELGKGSVFRVRLRAGAPKEMQVQRPARKEVARRGRILLIDDEPAIGRALSRTLAREHDVEAVESGRAGLELLAQGRDYDVILCDVMMPQMTGMELFTELARLHPRLAERVVFLTGGVFTAEARAFFEQVPNLRLDKPVTPGALREVVADLVRAAAGE